MAVKAEAKLFREQKAAAKDAHKAKLTARYTPCDPHAGLAI